MNKEIKRVCVFASSSNSLPQIYYRNAKILGQLLGKNGYDIVYGGSTLGLMWACAREVQNNNGKVIGIMPEKLVKLGCRTDNCDEFYQTKGMRERKAKLDEISDAVVALAGGLGTLEELTEMIVQKQLGYNKKPVVILNTNGYYNKLKEFFDQMIEEKFANANIDDIYYFANTPQDVIEYLKSYKKPEHEFVKHIEPNRQCVK